MTEALQLTIDFAFKQLNLHQLMANYSPTNVRSAKLLVRLNVVEGYGTIYWCMGGGRSCSDLTKP